MSCYRHFILAMGRSLRFRVTIFRVPTDVLLLRSFEVSPDRSMVRTPFVTAPSHLSWPNQPSLSLRVWVLLTQNTRTYAELLGPCSKTGRLNTFCQHQEGVSGRHPGVAAEAQHCTSPAPRQPLQASEPCLEAPPLLPGFYQAPRSTGRPIDQSVQPPLGGLPFSSFSVANSSEPMLTSGTTKVGRRRRLHETRMNRCKPALSAPPYTHTAPESVARQY